MECAGIDDVWLTTFNRVRMMTILSKVQKCVRVGLLVSREVLRAEGRWLGLSARFGVG